MKDDEFCLLHMAIERECEPMFGLLLGVSPLPLLLAAAAHACRAEYSARESVEYTSGHGRTVYLPWPDAPVLLATEVPAAAKAVLVRTAAVRVDHASHVPGLVRSTLA